MLQLVWDEEPQDLKGAKKWFEKAQIGACAALHELAFLYESGHGVRQDEKAAFRLYTRAAEQGFPNSQVNLALMYLNGRGTKPGSCCRLVGASIREPLSACSVAVGRVVL